MFVRPLRIGPSKRGTHIAAVGVVEKGHRIPSLDGLRAISIALVLLGHLAGTRGFPVSAAAGNWLGLGEFGVHVFFVISGFLITRLLLDELKQTGRISLGSFYFRRTLRIFPAYYGFLLVVFVASAAGSIQLAKGDLFHALTYTSNYDPGRSWFVGHTWSLSVEEQFYLLWPALIVLAGPRRALIAAAVAVLAAPLVRTGSWELMRWSGEGIGHRFETVADAVAIGCLLAGTRGWLHRSARYMKGMASPWFVLVPVLAVAGNMLHDHPVAHFLIGMSAMNVAVALALDWCLTFHSGRVGRVLNAAPLVYVGTLSYSLYLWQQLFLNRSAANAASAFPVNLLLVCAAALASFYLIERPSLQLRRRVETAWRRQRPAPAGAPLLRRQLDHENVLTEGAL